MSEQNIPDDIMAEAKSVLLDIPCQPMEPHLYDQAVIVIARALLAERQRDQWQPIETAPKGKPSPYGSGPRILSATIHRGGWQTIDIASWSYHKNPQRGSWRGAVGTISPTRWMPLPEPPKGGEA